MLPRGPASAGPPAAPASFRLGMARSAFLHVLRRLEEARVKGPVPRELEEEYDRRLTELNAAEAEARKAR